MKKVVLFVIDALSSRVAVPAMRDGRLPCLAALAERGTLRSECVSIFPSITPAATASIATGVYPVDHGIAGAFWYDREEDSVAYYGADFWVAIREGVGQFLNDFLIRLNHGHLQADTLYQHVERHELTAAVLNYMWFRGETRHEVNAPLLLQLCPGLSFAPQVLGPKILALADFVTSQLPGHDSKLKASGGMSRRFGFHDETTADYLNHLATADPFPDLTVAYLPNNDFASHEEGPENAVHVLCDVDQHIAEFFDRMGGMEAFLDEYAVVVVGDHSQSDLLKEEGGRGIALDSALEGFQRAKAGRPWERDDDLMICPNMRACHIYIQQRDNSVRDQVIARLLKDPRIDQVLWCASSWDGGQSHERVNPRQETFHVATSRGKLSFRYANSADANGHDEFGSSWEFEGDLSCVDAALEGDQIRFDTYPNAFERIATSFSDVAGDLWVTASRGCEFTLEETSVHQAGSHGSLHKDDSTTLLLAAGLPEDAVVPTKPRTVDVAPLILRALGLGADADSLEKSRLAASTM